MTTIDQTTIPARVHEDTISGIYDGMNTAFTLDYTPITGSLSLTNSSGLRLREGVDYTGNTKDLTALVAPASGDNWMADYYTRG